MAAERRKGYKKQTEGRNAGAGSWRVNWSPLWAFCASLRLIRGAARPNGFPNLLHDHRHFAQTEFADHRTDRTLRVV